MKVRRITPAIVERHAILPEGKDRVYIHETDPLVSPRGFGLEVRATKLNWVIRRGNHIEKLSEYHELDLPAARLLAFERARELAASPTGKRKKATLRELGQEYLNSIEGGVRESTYRNYRSHWDKYIFKSPLAGKQAREIALRPSLLDDLKRWVVGRVSNKGRDGRSTANAVLTQIQAAFNFAMLRPEYRISSNPATKGVVPRYRNYQKRTRELRLNELPALGAALEQCRKDKSIRYERIVAIWLIIGTGRRRCEILGAKLDWLRDWSDEPGHAPHILLPCAKGDRSGEGQVFVVPSPLVTMCNKIRRPEGCEYLIPGNNGKKLTNLHREMQQVLFVAGLLDKGISLRSFRHTWRSLNSLGGLDRDQTRRQGGWSGDTMDRVYDHVQAAEIAPQVNKMFEFLSKQMRGVK